MKSTMIITLTLTLSALAVACGGASQPLGESEDLVVRRVNGRLVYAEKVLVRIGDAIVRAVIGGVIASDTGDTGDTGGVQEICDLPMGTSTVAGRCQVGLAGGGTMECDCTATMNTSHDGDGMCVYEVEDIFVEGNCTGDDGEVNDPPVVLEQGW